MNGIFLMSTQKTFPSNFEIALFFLFFFFQPLIGFYTQATFSKKNCMQIFFCVHNVVLYTLMLHCFFSLIFFKNVKSFYFFQWQDSVGLDQSLKIEKF